MSFQEAIQSVFQKYICFSGRARRSEYWYFALLNWAVSAVLTAIARNFDSSLASLFLTLWNIGVFLPGLGVCWRRLHDIDRSGAWYFLNLIPPCRTDHSAHLALQGQPARLEPVRRQPQVPHQRRRIRRLRTGRLRSESVRRTEPVWPEQRPE